MQLNDYFSNVVNEEVQIRKATASFFIDLKTYNYSSRNRYQHLFEVDNGE